MNTQRQDNDHPGFLLGILAGTVFGAGLAMYFAPKVRSEIRRKVTDSAKGLGNAAAEYYGQASACVSDAADDLASKGDMARDAAAEIVVNGAHAVARGAHEVARGAQEVERFADRAAKTAGTR